MRFFEILTCVWNRFYLSILWLICCLPVFTVGASTTAYTGMLYRVRNKKEGYIAKGFFEIFSRNFKQSTVVWLIMMALGMVIWEDWRITGFLIKNYGDSYAILSPGCYLLLIIYVCFAIYVFAYIAKFEDDTKTVVKNSFFISLRHWGITITVAVIDIVIIYITLNYMLAIIFFLPMLIGSINTSFIARVLAGYEN